MAATHTPASSETLAHNNFPDLLGHPRPLWMLFMTEFWERFCFYGMRWALTLYVVAQFYDGKPIGENPANQTYGAFLALVYATGIFGGMVADRILGFQRAIMLGAVIIAAGLFTLLVPSEPVFRVGLALMIIGNGLFKPNISSMVGKLYATGDSRRDRGFTIFYMGINAGAFFSPLITGWAAAQFGGYKAVFFTAGIGMLISLLWFCFGRKQLGSVGLPPEGKRDRKSVVMVLVGALAVTPIIYVLLIGASWLTYLLGILFVFCCIMLVGAGVKADRIQLDKIFALLILFAFNILFWMFFEQAGSSFNFLAEKIVNRQMFGGWEFPVGWFQSVNPAAIVIFAPVIALIWLFLDKRNAEPSIPRKFGLGLLGNAAGFMVLMFALKNLVSADGLIPFWPLALCYVMQTLGELCLSPIGLSMVTKLAPIHMVGVTMGAWFLSISIGNNLAGQLAAHISASGGESGMTVASSLSGFTFSFYLLVGAGVVLLLISPLINKLMHGVK